MALNVYLTLRAPLESALTSFRPTNAYIDTQFQKVSTHDKGGHHFTQARENIVIEYRLNSLVVDQEEIFEDKEQC
ncbi:MAG: hypothetical protein QF752_15590 [Planctomycetota bacterium]|nr:hypothetical protein [Planctomycetota bacterium]